MGSSVSLTSTSRKLERIKHLELLRQTDKQQENKQEEEGEEEECHKNDCNERQNLMKPYIKNSSYLLTMAEDSNNDPMLAAANKLSQQYENERAALMHTTTCEPCILTTINKNSFYANNHTTLSDRFIEKFPQISNIADYESVSSNKDLMLQAFIKSATEIEKRKERDRQQRLHYTLKRAFNGIYKAKIKDPKLIVDWACGAGMWDLEMAEKFPDCKIIAIDYKQSTLGNIRNTLPNVEFRQSVINEGHTGMEAIESNTVDYVNMKDCWLINSPSHKWTNVLDQAFRILKPDGWIELSENSLRLESQGKATAQLDKYFRVFFDEMEIDRNIAEKLGDFLKLSGFISIEKTTYTVPVGEWPTAKDSKETGFLFRDMLEKRFRSLAKWLSVVNDVNEEEIQRVITVSLEEETQTNRSHIDWILYTARKPQYDSQHISTPDSNLSPPPPPPPPPELQQNVTSETHQV